MGMSPAAQDTGGANGLESWESGNLEIWRTGFVKGWECVLQSAPGDKSAVGIGTPGPQQLHRSLEDTRAIDVLVEKSILSCYSYRRQTGTKRSRESSVSIAG
jgi:hypothetical protein